MLQRIPGGVVVLVALSLSPVDALHGLRAKAVTAGWPHQLPATKIDVSTASSKAKRIPVPYDDDIEAVRRLAEQNRGFFVQAASAPLIRNCVRWSGSTRFGIMSQGPLYLREVAWHTRETMRCAMGRIIRYVEI
mmetsp:Transcript_10055/g.38070  ORF Transcript_10055/g.38070 Transcript_10055/m.38070 type:complete len:134 (-) Transcript_10055:73-474(-)